MMKKYLLLFLLVFLVLSSCKKKEEESSKYKVSFYDGETLLSEQMVEKGKDAVEPNKEKAGYQFLYWDAVFTNVQNDIIVHGYYKEAVYTIRYFVDGELYETEQLKYNESTNIALYPSMTGYNFIGWDQKVENVKNNMDVNAVFEKQSFKVTFIGYNDEVIEIQNIKYLESAVAPTIANTEDYEFISWDRDFSSITSDLTVKANYRTLNCKITYMVADSEYKHELSTFRAGTKTTLPILELDGYDFLGWLLSPLSRTIYTELNEDFVSDVTLYAALLETEIHSRLELKESDYHFTSIRTVPSGDRTVFQPVFPTDNPGTSVKLYDWSIDDERIASVSEWSSISIKSTGYTIITATLKENPNIFVNAIIHCTATSIEVVDEETANTISLVNVKFVDRDDTLIKEMKIIKGGSCYLPIPPVHEGYAFIGWDHDNYNINSDTTFKAQYVMGKTNPYVGKSFTIIGDSISTFSSYIPAGFASFYPYPTADVNDVNMTWWMRVINKLGGTLFVNNSYSGTCVADGSVNATKNRSRIMYNLLNGVAADVILIFMGANDTAASSITPDTFKSGYVAMLQHIKDLCPKSEIILLTLPSTSFYSESRLISMNNVIRSLATLNSLKLVELQGVSLDGHKVDSAHPDSSGMELIAEGIINGLIK